MSKLCQHGTPVVCGASGDACLKSVCVPETGAAERARCRTATAATTAAQCTATDACKAGKCVGSGTACVIAALSQCHNVGVCDKATGQYSNPEKPNNSNCNDGNACTSHRQVPGRGLRWQRASDVLKPCRPVPRRGCV